MGAHFEAFDEGIVVAPSISIGTIFAAHHNFTAKFQSFFFISISKLVGEYYSAEERGGNENQHSKSWLCSAFLAKATLLEKRNYRQNL